MKHRTIVEHLCARLSEGAGIAEACAELGLSLAYLADHLSTEDRAALHQAWSIRVERLEQAIAQRAHVGRDTTALRRVLDDLRGPGCLRLPGDDDEVEYLDEAEEVRLEDARPAPPYYDDDEDDDDEDDDDEDAGTAEDGGADEDADEAVEGEVASALASFAAAFRPPPAEPEPEPEPADAEPEQDGALNGTPFTDEHAPSLRRINKPRLFVRRLFSGRLLVFSEGGGVERIVTPDADDPVGHAEYQRLYPRTVALAPDPLTGRVVERAVVGELDN